MGDAIEEPNVPIAESRRRRLAAAALVTAFAVAACGSATAVVIDTDLGTVDDASSATNARFDSSLVHEISITFQSDDHDAMVVTFSDSGEKEWIEAAVTIDGASYERAGIRLKGNSSLRGLRDGADGRGLAGGNASREELEALPWPIRLDKYVEGQNHEGIANLVVRANTSASSLNEAVALELLDLAGLASEEAIAVRFTVNNGSPVLRLVVELPDEVWMAEEFSADGTLYKAESGGDYSYRGDDPAPYEEVFDHESGEANADLTPLIEFLAFINESDDATFAAELADHLDVASFATYLAMQELIANFDDIDGPGNNSYLYYDPDTGRFTVVPWDHNLAFGGPGGPGRAPGAAGAPAGDAGAGVTPMDPGGAVQRQSVGSSDEAPVESPGDGRADGFDRPGGHEGSNVLAERFLAVDDFAAMYEERLASLCALLYDSGVAEAVVDEWAAVLTSRASDLIDPDTVGIEAAAIVAIIDGSQ